MLGNSHDLGLTRRIVFHIISENTIQFLTMGGHTRASNNGKTHLYLRDVDNQDQQHVTEEPSLGINDARHRV